MKRANSYPQVQSQFELKPVKQRGFFGQFFKWGCLGVIAFGVFSCGMVLLSGNRSTKEVAKQTLIPTAMPVQSSVDEPVVESNTAIPTVQEVAPPSQATVASVASFPIGNDVFVDQVRWKVLSAEDLGQTLNSGNQFIDSATTTGRFIQVRLEVENRSNDMLSYIGIELIDDQGRKFTNSSDAIWYIDDKEICVLENLNPNITQICTHIFEVPVDAAGLKANVGDLKILGNEEALIDLGITALAASDTSVNQQVVQPVAINENVATQGESALGQDVFVETVRWKVLSAENLGQVLNSNNQFIDSLTTTGKFIRVRLEVENLDRDMSTYAGFDLIDGQGRVFTNSSDAIWYIDDKESCIFENLNPNLPIVCTDIFEVAADATGLKAKLGDLDMFSTAEALVDLGLQ